MIRMIHDLVTIRQHRIYISVRRHFAGTEIPLIFGTEILEQRGICIDEEVFVSEDVVVKYLNKRFYWDSSKSILIYTTPTEKYTIEPGTNVYAVNDKKKGKEEYQKKLCLHL